MLYPPVTVYQVNTFQYHYYYSYTPVFNHMSFVGKQLMGKVQQLYTMFPSTSKAFNQNYTFISTVVVLALILIIVTIYIIM